MIEEDFDDRNGIDEIYKFINKVPFFFCFIPTHLLKE